MDNHLMKSLKKTLRKALVLFILLPIGLSAQQSTITGVVTDAESGDPLIGVVVLVKGTQTGTTTDMDGLFSIKDQELPVEIEFKYVGYSLVTRTVESSAPIEVSLRFASELLDDIVVVGYGRQKKRVSTGAIAKLDAKEMEGIAVSDVASAMEGQMSGLIVNESSGQPGSSKTILIRGISTNGNNNPLYIVDGLQVDNIDNINPSDVESIDVLKDAASSAIYGARAANGVIIITTKKGSDDDEGRITYAMSYLNSRPWKLPEMMNAEEYVMITREKFENSNQSSALDLLGFPNVGDPLPTNTNWMNEVFNPAQVINHRITSSVKNAFFSFDYWNQEGVIGGEKSNYERYAVRLNSTKKIKDFATIGENLYLNRSTNNSIGTNSAFGGVQSDAFAYDPLTPVYNDAMEYGFAQSQWVQKEYINPLSRLFLINGDGKADQIQGNLYLEIEPYKGLRLKTDVGMDANWWDFRSFTPTYDFHTAAVNLTNDVAQGAGNFQGFQWENTANYNRTLREKHNLDLLVGTSYRTTQFRQVGGSTSNIPNDIQFNTNFQYLDSGQDTLDLAYGTASVNYALISTFGRVIYDFDEKYLFTATIRRDGSSNFGENNRFGIFPSVSLGWVVSNESFLNSEKLDFLKVRASWGINGSDRIAPLSFASRVQNSFTYSFGQDNQVLNTGAALAAPANPNIKWEESEQIDIGVEMAWFEGKLTVEADIYRKTTRDLLMEERIPGFIGATNNPISNLGEIRNQGVEVSIGYRVRRGDVKVATNLNYTHFKNKVINVAGESGFLNGWTWPVRNTAITRMTEGFAVGHFVGYQTDGIFQSQSEVFSHINADGELLQPNAQPGDIRFVDTNGDGIINSDDIGDIGDPWPKHIIGLSANVEYKGVYLSAIFNTQIGHDIYRAYERSDVTYSNYQTFWLDRWTPDSPSSELPALTANDPNNNQRPSDFYVEKGTFLRLRNLQLGYNLPKKWTDKAKMVEARIYLTGNNIFTLTKYRGFDPDIGTNGWILDSGIDKGFYPHNRSFGMGLNVVF